MPSFKFNNKFFSLIFNQIIEMGARRLANTLVKKNTYSTAINVLPNEIGALNRADVTER